MTGIEGRECPPVSLKDHLEAVSAAERRTTVIGAVGMAATVAAVIWGMLRATGVALKQADQILALHNDLIRKGEREAADAKAVFITRDSVRGAVMMAAALATVFIGYFALTGGAG